MTSEQLIELAAAAARVASSAPARPHPNTHAAKVAWSRIERLREALDGAGIEWKANT